MRKIPETSAAGKALAKLKRIQAYCNSQVFEREEEINGAILALLAGVSCVYVGDAGAAKTKLIKIISRFTGLRLFEIQIHETTKPESIFGIPDIPALAKGVQRHKIEGYAPTAEVVFFDEIFKAGGVVLNQLLTLLNEKQFRNGDEGILSVPLVSAFAASNEVPTDKSLRPLYDRFVLRFNIRYLQAEDNILRMMEARLKPEKMDEPEQMSREELAMLSRNITAVEIPDDIRRLIIRVRDQVQRGVKIVISDRRLDHSLRILQAQAFLDGRLTVKARDLSILSHLFWDDPKDAYKVKAICMASADAVGGDILSFEQLSQSVLEVAIESGNIQAGITKLRELLVTMKKFKSNAAGVRNAVRNRLDQLVGLLDQRKQFIVLVMNEPKGGYWLKLQEGTAQNWTPSQIREMGFKQKRNGGYWYTEMSEAALERKVMKLHKIEVMFRDIG